MKKHPGHPWLARIVVAIALLPATASAAIVEVSPGDDLAAAIAMLQPGDELVLHEGTYELTARLGVTLAGTMDAPIVIRAADGEVAHVHRAGEDQNIVDFDSVEHVIVRGIEFSGGSAGLRLSDARFFTIEDCHIHDTGDVALRANDGGMMYEGLRFVGNHIHHTNDTGEGMYLGCNAGGCQVFDSLIEGNYIHHTNQASIIQGDGIELKEGSHDNIIRDNVIHDTFYPCILTYSTVGNGGPNIIERNVMWNCGDHGIQSAADAVIRNNIILGAGSDGIAMQPHQSGSPSNLVVVHNTIMKATNAALSLRENTGMVTIANNALYAQAGDALFGNGVDAAMVVVAGNVGQGGVNGIMGVLGAGDVSVDFDGGNFGGAPPIDLFPAMGGALVGAGVVDHAFEDDFNCLAREGDPPDVGAYGYAPGGNPGWVITEDFKQCAAGGDGGSTGDDAGSDGGSVTDSGPDGSGDAGSGQSGSASNGESDPTASGSATEGGSGEGGAEGGDGGGKGCGCREPGRRATPWPMIGIVALARRRRRPR